MRRLLRFGAPTVAVLGLCAIPVQAEQAATPPAVQAEVDTTYVFADGRQVRVAGHYYRSQDGRVREDTGRGTVIADVNKGTLTLLNADTRQALVFTVNEVAPSRKPSGMSRAVPYARGRHEGRDVSKARVRGADGKESEVWTATDLGLMVFSRIESAGLTTTKSLRKVVQREPDPAVFTVPEDYAVEHHTLPALVPNSTPSVLAPGLAPPVMKDERR
jgi:hypothetical protein